MDRINQTTRALLIATLLGLLTLAVFWPVLHNDFIRYDDPLYVVENSHVLSGLTWQNVNWALHSGHTGNWYPLTWISHMLDVQLFGLRPAGHHLVSLLLHTANVMVLFLLLWQLTGAKWPGAFVAAFFGLHPLHVESVAWVAERKDVLSTFFFLLTLLAYAQYAKSRIRNQQHLKSAVDGPTSDIQAQATPITHPARWYLLTLALFALGLMSKPMLVTLPFVLLLLDCWPLRRFRGDNSTQMGAFPAKPARYLLVEKIRFFALSAASCAITLLVQQ